MWIKKKGTLGVQTNGRADFHLRLKEGGVYVTFQRGSGLRRGGEDWRARKFNG